MHVDKDLIGYTPYPWDLHGLQHAVNRRGMDIDPNNILGALFFATELGGECGEALNVIKKLERERLGIPGSRSDVQHLASELADTIITICNVARVYNIDLNKAVKETFNKVSEQRGLAVRL